MSEPRIANLHLDLDLDAEPIAGRLRGDGDDGRPFEGWVDLTRAIEMRLELARAEAVK